MKRDVIRRSLSTKHQRTYQNIREYKRLSEDINTIVDWRSLYRKNNEGLRKMKFQVE